MNKKRNKTANELGRKRTIRPKLLRENVLYIYEKCEVKATMNSSHERKNENNECISVPSKPEMRIKLPATAFMSDRFGDSDRTIAAVDCSDFLD